jgi:DNA-directed RNA polymerase specialized sigma24 family protein
MIIKTENNVDFKKLQDSSFNYAYSKTKDVYISFSIANKVTHKLMMEHPEGSTSFIESWVITNTKTLCSRYYRDIKKQGNVKQNYRDEYLTGSVFDMTVTDEQLKEKFYEVYRSLTEKELETYSLYHLTKHSFVKMNELTGIPISTLKKRIQRIKQKVKAQTNIKLGVMYTKAVLSPQVKNLIYLFLKRFKKNLEAGTVNKMYYYFSEVEKNNIDKTLDIASVENYEIEVKNGLYTLAVLYSTSANQINAFELSFKILRNHLKVFRLPEILKKGGTFDPNTEAYEKLKKLKNQYPPGKDGESRVPKELIDEIVEKYS